jgi:hypothetical protein
MIDSTMLASMFLLGLGIGVVFGWLAKSLRTQKREPSLGYKDFFPTHLCRSDFFAFCGVWPSTASRLRQLYRRIGK